VEPDEASLEQVYLRLLEGRTAVSWPRVSALLAKELMDLRGRPGLFFPAALHRADRDAPPGVHRRDRAGVHGRAAVGLGRPAGRARAVPTTTVGAGARRRSRHPGSLFQQFLVLLVLSPVAASMSLAAASVVGEKQARTLEPLLATPITTFELLLAKILGAFLPALALSMACFAVYAGHGRHSSPGRVWPRRC
jgi:hypothetical protein